MDHRLFFSWIRSAISATISPMDKFPTSFRLSRLAMTLLARIAACDGIDKTDVIESLIRQRAKALGLAVNEEEGKP